MVLIVVVICAMVGFLLTVHNIGDMMKKFLIATAMCFTSTVAYAGDTWLLCSYENLRGKTNIEKIVISETKTMGLSYGTISANNGAKLYNPDHTDIAFGDITKVSNGLSFTIEKLIRKTTYTLSNDLTKFSMTDEMIINGESLGNGNTFLGTCIEE